MASQCRNYGKNYFEGIRYVPEHFDFAQNFESKKIKELFEGIRYIPEHFGYASDFESKKIP